MNLSWITKFLFTVSTLTPVITVYIFQMYRLSPEAINYKIIIYIIIFIILDNAMLFCFILNKRKRNKELKISNYSSISGDIFPSLLTYMSPFLVSSFKEEEIILHIVLFSIVFLMMYLNNSYMFNILLQLAGYKFYNLSIHYKVDKDKTIERTIVLISRNKFDSFTEKVLASSLFDEFYIN